MKKYLKYVDNNRGASLVVIMAIFVLILVLGTHMLMAANASNNSLMMELDADAANVYVSSVYECINAEITSASGSLKKLSIFDKEQTISLEGFEKGSVTLDVKTDRTVVYDIPYTDSTGKEYMYEVYAKYRMSGDLDYLAEIRSVEKGSHKESDHAKVSARVFAE